MSDLSNLLGDLYGDSRNPDGPPVRHEPAATDRTEWSAPRTDDDLAAALARIEPAHRANLQRIATSVVDPAVVALPGFASFVELALAAVQGASVGAAVADTSHDVILDALEELFLARLSQPG